MPAKNPLRIGGGDPFHLYCLDRDLAVETPGSPGGCLGTSRGSLDLPLGGEGWGGGEWLHRDRRRFTSGSVTIPLQNSTFSPD